MFDQEQNLTQWIEHFLGCEHIRFLCNFLKVGRCCSFACWIVGTLDVRMILQFVRPCIERVHAVVVVSTVV